MIGALSVASVLGAAGCSQEGEERSSADEAAASEDAAPRVAHTKASVAITEPGVLAELEANGYGFGHHFGLADREGDGSLVVAQKLAGSPLYAGLVGLIERNVDAVKAGDALANVGTEYWHRLFDTRWLRSGRAHFRLIGVTNRMDRATADDCGEVRLVYRLEYQDPGELKAAPEGSQGGMKSPNEAEKWSRLPMTVVAVMPQPKIAGSCKEPAKRWLALANAPLASLASAAKSGPLQDLGEARTLETNLQSVRWPAGGWNEMGGHAEYMLNVYRLGGSGTQRTIALEPLENTPDVEKIRSDARLKQRLVEWVEQNLDAIDRGTAKLPAELLATTAFAIGPRGFARMGNRPWARLLADDGSALGGLDASKGKIVKSLPGLVRRLDELSCPGCHQSRSTAGFHLLGEEDPTNKKLDFLVVGTSTHMSEELEWRASLVESMAAGTTNDSPRPFAEHAKAGPGRAGAHCGLTTKADKTFEGWTCAEGFSCVEATEGAETYVGECMRAAPMPGDRCEISKVAPRDDSRERTYTEGTRSVPTVSLVRTLSCGAGSCSATSGGFPAGSCTQSCASWAGPLSPTRDTKAPDDVICGIAPPQNFDECIRSKRSFEDCMVPDQGPVTVSLRMRCDHAHPCRDDYACVRASRTTSADLAGIGQCMPPYFLFQARVDGHD
jgi:hypothetical protein